MLNTTPIQIEEERIRLVVERYWGIPPLCLRASRQGRWVVLTKALLGAEVKVVELGGR